MMMQLKFLLCQKFYFLTLSVLIFMPLADIGAQILLPLQPVQGPTTTYRGKRTSSDETGEMQRRFVVEKISIEQTAEAITLVISFNIPANPLSVSVQTIFVNSIPLSETTVIKFNRTGTELHVVIPIEEIQMLAGPGSQELQVCIKKITAYDGAKIDERQIDELKFGVQYRYTE